MFGYARDEMLGRALAEFNDPDYIRSGKHESQMLVTGKTDRIVTNRRYQRNDGTIFPAVVTTAAIRDEYGEFSFAVRAIQDVTESAQSRADMEQSERRFRAVFEGAPLGIALVLPGQAEIFDVNAEMEAMLGYSREDLLGHRLREFWAEHPSPEEQAISEELALGIHDRSGAPRTYLRQDGTQFHAFATSAAIRDEEGNLLYGVRIIQDVSDQVQALEILVDSEARFRAVFQRAPLPMLLIDAETHVLDVNDAAVSLFGYDSAEMSGRPMREFSDSGEVRLDGMRESEMLIAGEANVVSSERTYQRKDGTTFPAQVSTAAVRDVQGKFRYSIRAVQDLTAAREVERLKDEFIAVTSHELRTPVTAMHAAVTLVAQGAFGPMPGKAQPMMDIAKSNSDRLVALVNDLIDLERMNLGKVQLSPMQINAGEIAREAADLVQPLAINATVAITVEAEDVAVTADPGRILQTLQNLLSNAIKFSPAGSTITLGVSHDDTRVTFRVEDRGRGIPANQLVRIFDRFQQVDSSDTRGAIGTGLGLAIAKSIVEAHRGRIWAESELARGSTFFVELPTGQTWSPQVIDFVKGLGDVID
jgi:two-component system, OmpR family, sensor histidine kinase VicK